MGRSYRSISPPTKPAKNHANDTIATMAETAKTTTSPATDLLASCTGKKTTPASNTTAEHSASSTVVGSCFSCQPKSTATHKYTPTVPYQIANRIGTQIRSLCLLIKAFNFFKYLFQLFQRVYRQRRTLRPFVGRSRPRLVASSVITTSPSREIALARNTHLLCSASLTR